MTTIDVLPPALVSAAAAVRCFSAELHPVALRAGVMSEAITDFSVRWSRALDALGTDADAAAWALRDAAIGYAEVDAALVPRTSR